MKSVLSLILLLMMSAGIFAQTTEQTNTEKVPLKKKLTKVRPKDGFYDRKDLDSTKMVELPEVRDEDVYFAKRIWREIDLRDTLNYVLRAPKSALMNVIIEAVKNGELTAYATTDTATLEDDAFSNPLDPDLAYKEATGTSIIENRNTNKTEEVSNDYDVSRFLKFRIKEDWIFDTKRSIFEPRIVGLAPMKLYETGEWKPIFWIYYPEAREVLSKKRVVNTYNDASTLSFDDFFLRRLFASNIVKESNAGNDRIMDYISDPRTRLLESERIKKAILDYEQGMWQY